MQAPFFTNEESVKSFRTSISESRFARYLNSSNGDINKAIDLYNWNTELSKSLYSSLQMWEVVLRNRLNSFLCWKYTANWPYEEKRALRNLTKNEQRKIHAAIDRQRQLRGIRQVPTDAIVADLSAGFWVSLLAKSYEVPFVWRYNIVKICRNDNSTSRSEFFDTCSDLLDLRNRTAHHEPIYHLPLDDLRQKLDKATAVMCRASNEYAQRTCTFHQVWGKSLLSNVSPIGI